jgi:hypothetical protein
MAPLDYFDGHIDRSLRRPVTDQFSDCNFMALDEGINLKGGFIAPVLKGMIAGRQGNAGQKVNSDRVNEDHEKLIRVRPAT